MKVIPSLPFFLVLSLTGFSAWADVILLKNGDKVEGKIVSENETSIVVEVRVTASIRDEKIIPREDVLRIEKEKEDTKAFQKIAGFVPAPEMLDAEGYETRIEAIKAFLAEFPRSSKAPDAKRMLQALDEELVVVAAGGMKIGDQLVPAEDLIAGAYGYDALMAEKRIRTAAERRDFLGSLRLFEEYETRFGRGEGYAGLAKLMVQVLRAYRIEIEQSLAAYDARVQERQAGLGRMSMEDRTRTERAIKEQSDAVAKRYQEEKASKAGWITPDDFLKESLEETRTRIVSELTRLEAVEAGASAPLSVLYRASWEKLTSGTDEEKKARIEAAKSQGMPEYYLAKLRERAGVSDQ